jgi:hypothetical protein
MSQHDGTTPKYLAGFRAAVRAMMGPQPHQWAATYGDAARIEQMLQQAYQAGLIDGMSAAHPLPAPGPVEAAEEPEPDRGAAWASLGLFEAPSEPPGLLSEALATRPDLPSIGDTDPRVWSVRHARAVLTLSLVEGTDYVKGLLDD